MSLTGIATWNSALLPMDEVLSVSNLLGGNVAYGGDLAMAEFVVTGNIIRQSIALRYGNLRMPSE